MSQRIAKVESLIQHVVASRLTEILERDAASVTVTRIDAAPDMRNATVWVGLLGTSAAQDKLWARVERERGDLQAALATNMSTKFVPRLIFKRDTGGAYAAEIDRLLRDL
ncbi:MAG TPA: ribosome-binding factor A [Candidatus Saccharimonadia bacterium]|jgi:ribosome-binding factor A|nr:ribosome-binding factor A [Candidatus Saccharimonadia bacterium]